MVQIDDTSWFVAQLRPQGLARAQAHLGNQGYKCFAPGLPSTTLRAGVQKKSRTPLFPGYLFVSFDPATTSWSTINNTRGIARLILNHPHKPTPLPSSLMAGLKARCDADGLLLPPTTLKIGDQIRILSGPFADIVTTIESLPGPQRIGVLIDLMRRKVRTSLPLGQIEKLE